jgi:hypothetical protein
MYTPMSLAGDTKTMTKTTCTDHRTLGYYYTGSSWLCRGCFGHANEHETNEETMARRAEETSK